MQTERLSYAQREMQTIYLFASLAVPNSLPPPLGGSLSQRRHKSLMHSERCKLSICLRLSLCLKLSYAQREMQTDNSLMHSDPVRVTPPSSPVRVTPPPRSIVAPAHALSLFFPSLSLSLLLACALALRYSVARVLPSRRKG